MKDKSKRPLTDEQRKLIEDFLTNDGEKIIEAIIMKTIKKKISEDEMDEYKSVSYEALIKAARRFNPDKKAKFSTFAWMTVQSALKTYLTYENRDKRVANKRAVSLEYEDEDGRTLIEILVGDTDIDYESADRIKSYLSTLSTDAKKVLMMRVSGYKYLEISKKLNFDAKYMKSILQTLQKYERVKILRRR